MLNEAVEKIKDIINVESNGQETQTVTLTDIISEGPIEGLCNGVKSVYLNDSPVATTGFGSKNYTQSRVKINLFNDTNTAIVYSLEEDGALDEAQAILDAYEAAENNPNRIFHIRGKDAISVKSVFSSLNGASGSADFGRAEWGLEATDGSSNWWQDDWLSEDGDIDVYGNFGVLLSNFKPVTLVHTVTGSKIPGKLVSLGANHPVSSLSSKRIIFVPGNLNEGTFIADPDRYTDFKHNTDNYELFIDTSVTVERFSSFIELEEGHSNFFEKFLGTSPYYQILNLTENWDKNTVLEFSNNITNSTFSKTNHGLITGDVVVYKNEGTGSDYGGLSSYDLSDSEDITSLWVYKVNDNSFKLAESRQKAYLGETLTITSGSSVAGTPHHLERHEYDFDDLGFDFSNERTVKSLGEFSGSESTVVNTQVQFRSGRLHQEPFHGPMGHGATSVTKEVNEEVLQTVGYGEGDQEPITLVGSSSSGFNLSSGIIEEVSEISLRFKYPGGFKAVSGDGYDLENYARYKLTLEVKRPNVTYSGGSFGKVVATQLVEHRARANNAVNFESTFNMSLYKPFTDFRVSIHRQTDLDKPSYTGVNSAGQFTRTQSAQNLAKSVIDSVSSLIELKLNYPLTAMGRVSFSSKAFGTPPTRSYHCRGMIVKVPSNYVTREESLSGKATYTRRDGRDSGVATDWDGTFREVYTNNPAWIFYDMVTNNRYGLGDFIKETDIDKYSLYRIGKYCDELVDDGKGGQEARYTLNTYLTQSADAYKVLKDICTNFLSMLYYLDGKIFLVQDAPDSPTHSFSKANVIDGAFQYETTGTKTRANQVQVIWNNPNNNYKQEPLIVEDRRNISETGRIITTEAVAFGCTSEGQATRYGKWKLWTAVNQNEIVSFKTATEGSLIAPGQIILVQDADRHATRLSGRVSGKLIDNLSETATYSGAIGSSVSGFSATQRAQPAVFSGIAVLPSSFSNSAEVLFEHGGTGTGTLVGMVDVGGTKKLLVRSGQGTVGSTASDVNQVVKFINISDIPEFNDKPHRVTLEVHPTATGGGSVRFWIDNRLVVDETTTGNNFNSDAWSGGDAGGWGERGSSLAGYDSTTTPTNTDFQNWSGALHTSLSVYSNQTVSTFPTTTTIPLDSSVTLNSGSTYELSLIYSKHSAFNRDSVSPSYQVEGRYDSRTNTNILTLNATNGNSEIHKLIKVGMSVSGTGIASNTTVTAVGENTVTMNQNGITSNFSNSLLTFAGGTYSAGDLVTYAYVDDDNDQTATFQEINTSEKASNARGTPSSDSFLNITFSENSRVETKSVSTSSGTVTSLTVSEAFSEACSPGTIWVLNETSSSGFTVSGSGKKYKVLSISQEQNEQYNIVAAEYYDEKYSAVEEDFTTYVEKSISQNVRLEKSVPPPIDAWIQRVDSPEAKNSDRIIIHWTYPGEEGIEVTQSDGTVTTEKISEVYRGLSGVEITHTFDGIQSPIIAQYNQDGSPNFVVDDVKQGLHFIELRTVSSQGRKSKPVHLEVFIDEKLKRRDTGFFPGALHTGASSNKGTEIV